MILRHSVSALRHTSGTLLRLTSSPVAFILGAAKRTPSLSRTFKQYLFLPVQRPDSAIASRFISRHGSNAFIFFDRSEKALSMTFWHFFSAKASRKSMTLFLSKSFGRTL